MSIHEPEPIRSVGEEQPRACIAGAPYRFTVEQYHEMIDAGILGENDRIEFLEGGILHMSPKGPRHVFAVQELAARLAPLLPADWHLRTQDPLTLADSEPEPDLAIVRGARRDYAARHPGAAEVGLVIEVADSSLEFDRSVKLRIYAAAGIAVYWVVNLDQQSIEVYRELAPVTGGARAAYSARQQFGAADAVSVCIAGREIGKIAVAEIVPKA